ncbi:unnamed protein product [Ilex paraguariensis]|uniref:HMA domain-containing protein n=1 Tax=Ilex paraguariensis TaxID=185542 RepID=A0ABC8T7Q0_9AQUA
MESTLSATTTTMSLLAITKTLNPNSSTFVSQLHRRFSTNRSSNCLRTQLETLQFRRLLRNSNSLFQCHGSNKFGSISSSTLRSLGGVDLRPMKSRLECVSSSAASFASGGGGIDGSGSDGNGGGGGGGGAAESGEVKVNLGVRGAEDVSALSSDVIILDVGGMTCGGCAASVKRILESQPHVSSASVNLTTETAIVWPVSEVKVAPNWQKELGEELAKHLTTCGFKSNLRGQEAIEGDILS